MKRDNKQTTLRATVLVLSVIVLILAFFVIRQGKDNITGRYNLTKMEYGGYVVEGRELENLMREEGDIYLEILDDANIYMAGFGEGFNVTYTREGDTLYGDDGYEIFAMRIDGKVITMTYGGLYLEYTKK
ncbi:MAG: hypothetical protein FWD45_01125 [Coriobacteriia bacterium]|nr:hypothetical protein [Coriobacteriia bacterium]